MMNDKFYYLTTIDINEKVVINNKEEVVINLIEYIGSILLNKLDNIIIEYAINNDIIYILINTDSEIKIKTSLINKHLHTNIINIEGLEELPYLIKCRTKLLKVSSLDEYFKEQNKTNYQKQKEAIYKWRQANKETYLLKQHQYFKDKLSNEEFRKANLQRIKNKNKEKKEELEKQGIFKKVGRPSKY